MDENPRPKQSSDRLTTVESLITHLERQLADLNGVVLDHARKIDGLEKQIRALQNRYESHQDAERLDDHPSDE